MTALDDARAYIGQAFGPQYEAWMLLDDTAAMKTLVSTARLFNALPWQGTATGVLDGNPTSLAWPRTGVFVDGVEIDSLTIPADVTMASFEMAVLINAKPALPNQLDTGSNIKAANAGGGVGVEYFVPTSARFGNATTLPVIVLRLIAKYLAGQNSVTDGGSAGIGAACSQFGVASQFTLSRPE